MQVALDVNEVVLVGVSRQSHLRRMLAPVVGAAQLRHAPDGNNATMPISTTDAVTGSRGEN